MRQSLAAQWQPIVSTYSTRDKEQTYIYLAAVGKDLKLIIATIETHEATIMEVTMNPNAFAKWLNNLE